MEAAPPPPARPSKASWPTRASSVSSVQDHSTNRLRHARGFVAVARPLFSTAPRLVDMGAGGGLPGLVVAHEWPEATLVLLEANERRSAFLKRAVDGLELSGRVAVLQERAEIAGRDRDWRASFDGAIARSFGRPAVLAECTAPLLKVGAWVVVSEPPAAPVVETVKQAILSGGGNDCAGGSQERGGSDAVARRGPRRGGTGAG